MKRYCPKRSKEKEKKQNDDGVINNKRTDVTGLQLHIMLTPSVDVLSGTDFSDLGEYDEFTWHQFHVKVWGAQDFEGHTPVAMHNATGWVVPLT